VWLLKEINRVKVKVTFYILIKRWCNVVLVLHPVGNQNVRALINGLQQHQMLETFHTSIAWRETAMDKFIPNIIIRELKRREYAGIDNKYICTHPLTDICRLLSIKLNNISPIALINYFHPELTYDYVDKKAALYIKKNFDQISMIYGYDDKCLSSFRMGKLKGIKLTYEAAFAYAPYINNVFYEEKELQPEWADNINFFTNDRLEKQDEELELADKIIVASSYAKRTLVSKNFDHKITTIPYGSPNIISKELFSAKKYNNKKLRVLFVGALTQRKGISYLFNALDKLGENIELNIIGASVTNELSRTLKNHLAKHKWIPSMSHTQILEYMYTCDVLILPSIAEAFGLVLLEALSRGLPIIASENTGAPDIITHGKEGFIIPIRNSDAIANHLTYLDENRGELERMSNNAWLRAGELTWDAYQNSIVSTLKNQLAITIQ
jgi:glycosyltransferase involved in cell wall biosynthesis